ncbi:AhpC/TSA family protein [Polystyrenella longa]|uniref:AhpC/TSA family protein n=1 Tax=Polystyrenella longa TaxID=2528007 RepID=A0A518CN65_9PLAN|nr:SelL-related redox protein [Polystyrenella longa]QDU80671.1 AhpC/TSA family protein [Polystyrenella longa]
MTETAPLNSDSIPSVMTSTGQSLADLSQDQTLLIVFLRHSGCSFCRQALADLHKIEGDLGDMNTKIVVVSMSEQEELQSMLKKYQLPEAIAVSDPARILYQHFQFGTGGLAQLMGPSVLWNGMKACIFEGHGVGKPEGNVRQMPGVIVLRTGQVLYRYQHKNAGDRPDYLQLVQQAITS